MRGDTCDAVCGDGICNGGDTCVVRNVYAELLVVVQLERY